MNCGFLKHLSGFATILLFLPFALFAQSKTDSLQQLLRSAKGAERVELLLQISSFSRQKDPEKALVQAEEAFRISHRLENKALQARSLKRLGFLSSGIDRDSTALRHFLHALKLSRQLGNQLSEADILHSLGRFYNAQGNHPMALDYFFQALRIFHEKRELINEANTLSYIGDVYRDRGETEQAAIFFKQALVLGQETGNLKEISISAVKAANMLHQLGRFKETTQYFDTALNAAKEMNSVHAQAGILLVMSSAYQDENLYDRAFGLNQELLEIAKLQNNKILLGRGYENLAGIYTEKGELEQANMLFAKARRFYDEVKFPTLPVTRKLMDNLIVQNQAGKAVEIGEKALASKQKTASHQNKKNLLESLVKAYEKQGQVKKALMAQNRIIDLTKKIYDTEKAQQIAEMQTRFETGQKEKEIALLEKKQEKSTLMRNALVVGLILLVIIAALIYNRQRLKIVKNKTNLENTRLKQHQLKQDLDFKNKQLTTHSLNLVQKNEVMKELKQRISDLQDKNGKTDPNLKSLSHLIDYSFNLDKDWEEFKLYFEEVHVGFFDALKKHFPDLTTNEIRLSALVKLNLTIKEIATIMSISPDSVKTARYRLRKKMDLETDENLSDYLNKIERDTTSGV